MASRRSSKRGLTARERKFIRGRVQGLSQRAAALRAGYSLSVARSKASDILRRPLVQSALTDALRRHGITLSKLVKPIADALKANLTTTFMGVATETKIPDHKTRLDACEMGLALHGGLPKQVELPPLPTEPLTVIFEGPDGTTTGIHLGGRTEGPASPPPPAR